MRWIVNLVVLLVGLIICFYSVSKGAVWLTAFSGVNIGMGLSGLLADIRPNSPPPETKLP